MSDFEKRLTLITIKKIDENAQRVANDAKKETAKVVALAKNSRDQIENPKAVARGGQKGKGSGVPR